jgi:hypothetical protein
MRSTSFTHWALVLALAAGSFYGCDLAPREVSGVTEQSSPGTDESAAMSYHPQTINGKPYAVSEDGAHRYELMTDEQYNAASERFAKTAEKHLYKASSVAPAPASHSLRADQTPPKDQAGRGLCWAFAGIGGVEAFYHRTYGVTLDLSEQYLAHLSKSTELYTDYMTTTVPHENNSSAWGNQGNSGIIHLMTAFALPEETDAPYLSQADVDALHTAIPASGSLDGNSTQEELDAYEWDTRNIPTEARYNAQHLVTTFDWVGSTAGSSELENIISQSREIVADFKLRWKKNAATGVYEYDATVDKNTAGVHCMLIIGYDRNAQTFQLKNSWAGSAWISVDYAFMNNCFLGGTVVTAVSNPNTAAMQTKARWLCKWNINWDGWQGQLVIRRFINYRADDWNAATKLGDLYKDGKSYDVNGYYDMNGRRMVCYVDFSTDAKVQPGTLSGQKFELYTSDLYHTKAAGVTYWNNIPFGVQLSRSAISSTAGAFSASKWIGTWSVYNDGGSGTLSITAVTNNVITATYKTANGTALIVSGTLDASHTHHLTLSTKATATARPRYSDLYYHTRTANLAGGHSHMPQMSYSGAYAVRK